MIWPMSKIALRIPRQYISRLHQQHCDRSSSAYVEIGSILELGVGSSTAIFANYIKKYGGTLHSVDESEKWLKNSPNLAWVDTNDSRFQFRHCLPRLAHLAMGLG